MSMRKVVVVFQGGLWHQKFSSLVSARINLLNVNFTGTQCTAWGPCGKGVLKNSG